MREELGFRMHETRFFSLQSPLLLQGGTTSGLTLETTFADIFPRAVLLLPLAVMMQNVIVSDFEVPHRHPDTLHTCELPADKDRGDNRLVTCQ